MRLSINFLAAAALVVTATYSSASRAAERSVTLNGVTYHLEFPKEFKFFKRDKEKEIVMFASIERKALLGFGHSKSRDDSKFIKLGNGTSYRSGCENTENKILESCGGYVLKRVDVDDFTLLVIYVNVVKWDPKVGREGHKLVVDLANQLSEWD